MVLIWCFGTRFLYNLNLLKMKSKLESKISVTFYLKKVSLKTEVKKKAVYATIAFKGTAAKMSTGIKCENPEKDWKSGMFEGKNFTDENLKLLSIRREIESYEIRFFKSADHIKAVYNGVENNDIPMTILGVLNEKIIEKKSEVTFNTYKMYVTAINSFTKWMHRTKNPDFGVHQSHPQKITRRIVKSYWKFLLEQKVSYKKKETTRKESSAAINVSKLGTLYLMFYNENRDDIDGLVVNPFISFKRTLKKHELQEQALERELDWKWIDKIEQLRYQLPNGVVTNEVDLTQKDCLHRNGLNYDERIVKDEKLRLLSLILAHTGLSWVDLGKEDVFQIQRSITGPVLIGRRVKTKEKYTIPVTPKLEELIIEMGSLPWKPFVENNVLTDHAARQGTYMNFYNYLNERLAPQIGFDEDDTISPHRFRHSFAMRMLNHFKFSLHVVARMLGDLESTVRQNYADYDDDTITAAFNEEMKRYLKNKKDDDKSKEEIAV